MVVDVTVDISPFIHEALFAKVGYKGKNLRKNRIGKFLEEEEERQDVLALAHNKIKNRLGEIPNLAEKLYLCFDPFVAKSLRYTMYPDYKGTREEKPWSGKGYRMMIKEYYQTLRNNKFIVMEADGMEADDIIAQVTKWCVNNKRNCIVLTPDSDMKQLVHGDEHCEIMFYDMNKGEVCVNNGFTVKKLSNSGWDDFGGIFSNEISDNKINDFFDNKVEIDARKILLTKIVSGDKSDNIIPCMNYVRGSSTMNITDKRMVKALEDVDDTKDDWEFVSTTIVDNLNEVLKTKKVEKHITDVSKFEKAFELNKMLVKLNTIDFGSSGVKIEEEIKMSKPSAYISQFLSFDLGYETDNWMK